MLLYWCTNIVMQKYYFSITRTGISKIECLLGMVILCEAYNGGKLFPAVKPGTNKGDCQMI